MSTDNPYVGLRPFDTDESLIFFGRNDQVLELLQRLYNHHFVSVVGTSGCGKSSLLRAGLIPALKAGFLVAESDRWNISVMKPGQNPLYSMSEAILRQLEPDSGDEDVRQFAKQIREEGKDAILARIKESKVTEGLNFFLLVDQFEELFRISLKQANASIRDEVYEFVSILLELSALKDIPFFVVITMRSDFIGDCSQFYGLPEAMNQSLFLVPRLSRVQLRTVIEGPAKLYGGKLNPSITSLLLNELDKVNDELPLLQHALLRMWNYEMNVNRSGEIDFEDYEKIGKIEGALSQHAEEALKGLDASSLQLAKTIFQALTTVDENGRKIRRPVRLKLLCKISGESPERVREIIDLFNRDQRSFLVLNRTEDPADLNIDISHESLIRQWSRLSEWVDEEKELASTFRRLTESSMLYSSKKKDLLSGVELDNALPLRKNPKISLSWAHLYRFGGYQAAMNYLDASEKAEEKRKHQVKRKKYAIRIGIYFLGIAGLSVAGYFLFLNYRDVSAKADNAVVKFDSLARRTDSTTKFKDSLNNMGISNAKIETYQKSDLDRIARMNELITSLEKYVDTSISITYFPKLSDQDKAVLALRKLGYNLVIAETKESMANTATNAIWIGSEVNRKAENVKLVALYLMRAGIRIKSIRKFDRPDGDKSNVIQIGAGKAYVNNITWTASQVMKCTSFDGDGSPPAILRTKSLSKE